MTWRTYPFWFQWLSSNPARSFVHLLLVDWNYQVNAADAAALRPGGLGHCAPSASAVGAPNGTGERHGGKPASDPLHQYAERAGQAAELPQDTPRTPLERVNAPYSAPCRVNMPFRRKEAGRMKAMGRIALWAIIVVMVSGFIVALSTKIACQCHTVTQVTR